MAEIFVSYRREDSQAYAGRICDLLGQHLGPEINIFRDVDSIQPGEDFGRVIEGRLADCKIFLALIGPRWSKARSRLRRRLFQPNDLVRREIFIAINRPIVVIPVLVGSAEMPAARSLPKSIVGLAKLNGFKISESRFREEVAELAERVKQYLAKAPLLNERALQAEREHVQELINVDLQEGYRHRRRNMIAAWIAAIITAGVMILAVRQFILLVREKATFGRGAAVARVSRQTLDKPQFGHPDSNPAKLMASREPGTSVPPKLKVKGAGKPMISPPNVEDHYRVNLLIPTSMSNAMVWLDGHEARILTRTASLVTIEVPADSSNHQIRLEKDGLPACVMSTSVTKDGVILTPCQFRGEVTQ